MFQRMIATQETWLTLPLRLTLGILFVAHGGQKLFGWFGGHGLAATAGFFETNLGMSPGLIWAGLAGAGEFFGGLLVLLGLATRFGAANIAVTMLVAMIKVHWGSFFLPTGIEYTLALLGASVALFLAGGGRFSLDGILLRRWNKKRALPAEARVVAESFGA